MSNKNRFYGLPMPGLSISLASLYCAFLRAFLRGETALEDVRHDSVPCVPAFYRQEVRHV